MHAQKFARSLQVMSQIKHLRRVLEKLWKAGFTANPRKRHPWVRSDSCLPELLEEPLKPQEKKVKAACQYLCPSSKKQTHAFLGHMTYYCCCLPNFASVAVPLPDLTKKAEPKKVNWTPAAGNAFQALKMALSSSPVLRNPDFECSFLVYTDASESSLGAVLSLTVRRIPMSTSVAS